jgi:hypothetical protein
VDVVADRERPRHAADPAPVLEDLRLGRQRLDRDLVAERDRPAGLDPTVESSSMKMPTTRSPASMSEVATPTWSPRR